MTVSRQIVLARTLALVVAACSLMVVFATWVISGMQCDEGCRHRLTSGAGTVPWWETADAPEWSQIGEFGLLTAALLALVAICIWRGAMWPAAIALVLGAAPAVPLSILLQQKHSDAVIVLLVLAFPAAATGIALLSGRVRVTQVPR